MRLRAAARPGDSSPAQDADPRERLWTNLHRSKIPGLDGIRGIAAMTVVLFHAWTALAPGAYAVLMFFVLSGLLITWLLLSESERDKAGSVNLRAFYVRRGCRLLPPLIAMVAFQVWLGRPQAPSGFALATLLYVANYSPFMGIGSNGTMYQVWSLAVEEHFYMIWPCVFGWTRDRRRLLRWVAGAAALTVVLRFVLGRYVSNPYAGKATETNATGILLGCAVALVLWHSPRGLPKFLFHPTLVPASLAAIFGLHLLSEAQRNTWGATLVLPFLAILLLQAIANEWWILENPVARFFGKISYPVYLWHVPVLRFVRSYIPRGPLSLIAIVCGTVLLSAASYYAIEIPFQRWGRHLQKRLPLKPMAQTARAIPP